VHTPATRTGDATRAPRHTGDGDRRAANDDDRLTAEELALIASCGERIRNSDWDAIRRAGLVSWHKAPDGRSVVPLAWLL